MSSSMTLESAFAQVPYTPPDAVFALKAAFDKDTSPDKVNLGPGAYLNNDGRPWILSSVAEAEKRLAVHPPGHEYLPILGLPAFRSAAASVVFGANSKLLQNRAVATIQAVSGTGAIHLALSFLRHFTAPAKIFVSRPSWSNHRIMAEFLGFDVVDYPYYDPVERAVDFSGMKKAMESCEPGTVWILHACAHNPTGCDLSQDQWKELGEVIKARRILPILDSAYQGFASGDLDDDAWSIRYLLDELEIPGIVCQSFSKSMGLYGERVGAVHVVNSQASSTTWVDAVESQVGWISRKEISVPPRYGATIAATIIDSPELYEMWQEDLRVMSNRLTDMRQAVYNGLTARGTAGSWKHVIDQIGMFSFTGLTAEQVDLLRQRHIYLLSNGRVSLSGLNEGNVDYFCRCVHEVVTETSERG